MNEKISQQKTGWRDVLTSLKQPKVSVMLMLGFSAGIPFMLVGNTLGFWLREGGIELSTIGFLSWIGIVYSMKFLWSPIIDRTQVPILSRLLGRRRGWMMLSQIVIGVALFSMAIIQPEGGLWAFGALALVAAFASSTQDMVIDAWRIESADNNEEMALLVSGYQLGYRTALLITDALILILATHISWSQSYQVMALLMSIGLVATYLAKEPKATAVMPSTQPLYSPMGFFNAVAGPFIAFFKQHAQWALLMLVAISLYRLPDFVMGPMANPFYADLGISKAFVGEVRGSVGLIASIMGIAAGGLFAVRFGFVATLLVGAILGPASNLGFAYLAYLGPDHGPNQLNFMIVMVIDNFAAGFAGTALVAYMSSLTNIGYTATQYALLSSFYAFPGKILKGFSGVAVEYLQADNSILHGYTLFFIGTALIGIPAFIACFLLSRRKPAATPR